MGTLPPTVREQLLSAVHEAAMANGWQQMPTIASVNRLGKGMGGVQSIGVPDSIWVRENSPEIIAQAAAEFRSGRCRVVDRLFERVNTKGLHGFVYIGDAVEECGQLHHVYLMLDIYGGVSLHRGGVKGREPWPGGWEDGNSIVLGRAMRDMIVGFANRHKDIEADRTMLDTLFVEGSTRWNDALQELINLETGKGNNS